MIVYRYGALRPTEGFGLLLEELKRAHTYRNKLIELELWRRAALDFGSDKQEVKAAFSADQRAARKASGLGWGTYQLVEQDVQRASKTRTPRFRSFDGTGRVGAAVQACSNLQAGATSGPCLISEPDSRGCAVARLRVTVDGWIALPIRLHRPIPVAQIVRAIVNVARIGDRWVYSVQLTLRADAPERQFGEAGRVAINFGWRRKREGIRVAYAVADDGTERELVLPHSLVNRFVHAEGLRALADKQAVEFLGDARRRTRTRNAALRGKPLDPRRRALAMQPVEPTSSREHWARRDRHLYQWERDEYASAMRSRAEIYRLWVRGLAAEFSGVVVENYDLTRVISRESLTVIPGVRHVRFLVAPASLRQEVKAVFGDRCKLAKQGKTTTTCNECGNVCEWDQAREIVHRCEWCGSRWDQDANNARNQLTDSAAE